MRRITLDGLNASRDEISALRELLANGGVVALPTETFYGFAADPQSATGVERICRIKGRDAVKALPVLFAGGGQLSRLGLDASSPLLEPYFQIWPAPLTVVLPIREPIAASRGVARLGLRIPADRALRVLLEKVGPLTGTSANRSGSPPLDDPDAVEALFRREIDWLIDGGRTPGGKPSTVVDASATPPQVLRAGAFAWPAGGPPR